MFDILYYNKTAKRKWLILKVY